MSGRSVMSRPPLLTQLVSVATSVGVSGISPTTATENAFRREIESREMSSVV